MDQPNLGVGLWRGVRQWKSVSGILITIILVSNEFRDPLIFWLRTVDVNMHYRWEIRQSDYFAISAWGGNRQWLRGNMKVYIRTDWGDTADWGCGRAKDIAKDMISAMNGWAGAFFGIISTDFCG